MEIFIERNDQDISITPGEIESMIAIMPEGFQMAVTLAKEGNTLCKVRFSSSPSFNIGFEIFEIEKEIKGQVSRTAIKTMLLDIEWILTGGWVDGVTLLE